MFTFSRSSCSAHTFSVDRTSWKSGLCTLTGPLWSVTTALISFNSWNFRKEKKKYFCYVRKKGSKQYVPETTSSHTYMMIVDTQPGFLGWVTDELANLSCAVLFWRAPQEVGSANEKWDELLGTEILFNFRNRGQIHFGALHTVKVWTAKNSRDSYLNTIWRLFVCQWEFSFYLNWILCLSWVTMQCMTISNGVWLTIGLLN